MASNFVVGSLWKDDGASWDLRQVHYRSRNRTNFLRGTPPGTFVICRGDATLALVMAVVKPATPRNNDDYLTFCIIQVAADERGWDRYRFQDFTEIGGFSSIEEFVRLCEDGKLDSALNRRLGVQHKTGKHRTTILTARHKPSAGLTRYRTAWAIRPSTIRANNRARCWYITYCRHPALLLKNIC